MQDVIVIGSSIAGSFLGYLLNRQDQTFSFLTSDENPGTKACGESLSLIGQRYLKRSGLWDKYLEKESSPYYSYNIEFPGKCHIVLKNKKPLGYSIPRSIIDEVLFKAATSNHCANLIKEQVLSIEQSGNNWIVKTNKNVYHGKNIVLAAGFSARKLIKGAQPSASDHERYGLAFKCKGHWQSSNSKNVYLQNMDGYQIILNPLNDTVVNLNILVEKNKVPAKNSLKDFFIKEALTFALQKGFTCESTEECKGASSLSSSQSHLRAEGLYCIGDAAEVLDPIGGMGMSHALFSASLAAEAILQSIARPEKSSKFCAAYRIKRHKYARIFRALTGIAYKLNVRQSGILIKFTTTFPFISQSINKFIGDLFPVVGAVTYRQTVSKQNYELISSIKMETI